MHAMIYMRQRDSAAAAVAAAALCGFYDAECEAAFTPRAAQTAFAIKN